MTCVCPCRLALPNAVLPSCRRGSEGRGGGGGGRRGGRGRGLWAARRGGAAPTQGPSPQAPPYPSPPRPLTPPSSALCALAHPVFGLEVHPVLHEALEGGEVALLRRIAKSRLLRLRAQPSALSASHDRAGSQGWGLGPG